MDGGRGNGCWRQTNRYRTGASPRALTRCVPPSTFPVRRCSDRAPAARQPEGKKQRKPVHEHLLSCHLTRNALLLGEWVSFLLPTGCFADVTPSAQQPARPPRRNNRRERATAQASAGGRANPMPPHPIPLHALPTPLPPFIGTYTGTCMHTYRTTAPHPLAHPPPHAPSILRPTQRLPLPLLHTLRSLPLSSPCPKHARQSDFPPLLQICHPMLDVPHAAIAH